MLFSWILSLVIYMMNIYSSKRTSGQSTELSDKISIWKAILLSLLDRSHERSWCLILIFFTRTVVSTPALILKGTYYSFTFRLFKILIVLVDILLWMMLLMMRVKKIILRESFTDHAENSQLLLLLRNHYFVYVYGVFRINLHS